MYEHWNQERNQRRYKRVLENATDRGFTEQELEKPYLTDLLKQTKSLRIRRMVELAYYLGQLRAVRDIDDGYTPVTFSQTEKHVKGE